MTIINLFMIIGTSLAALATLPQILAVFENRDSLRGYNPYATFGLFWAMVCFSIGFYLVGNWLSVLCEVPVSVYWLMATIYSWKIQSSLGKVKK